MIGTSEAAALMAVDIIVQRDDARPPADDPPRAYAPDNWTLDADAFECRCPAAARRISDAGAAMKGKSAAQPRRRSAFR